MAKAPTEVAAEIVFQNDKDWSRVIMMVKQHSPFFFTLLHFLDRTWDLTIPRAATDYKRIFLHPIWFNKIDLGEKVGTVLHELLHNAMRNDVRRKWRLPKRWNRATDIVNNGMICKEFCKKKADGTYERDAKGDRIPSLHIRLPDNVIIREDLEDFSAEEVYDILTVEEEEKKKNQKNKPKKQPPQQGDGGGGEGEEGEEEEDGDGDGDGGDDEDDEDQGVSATKSRHNDEDPDHDPACFHPDAEKNAKEAEESGQTSEQTANAWRNAIRRAMDTARQQGKLSAAMEQILRRELGEGQVNWRDLLHNFTTKSYEDFVGPYDRRFINQGYYFETLESETVEVDVCIDTSGSVGIEKITELLGEVKGILRAYPKAQGSGFWADAALFGPMELEEMLTAPAKGFGGTSFVPFFDYLEANPKPRRVAIYLTDGYGDFPTYIPQFEVLWLVIPGGAPDSAFPFGQVVRMIEV